MRKSNLLSPLFSKTRQGVLAATFGHPERRWYLSELADWIGTAPSSLQRELKSLSETGILKTVREGNRTYFQAETDSPIFNPLRELVAQTLGVVPALKEVLFQFDDRIGCAFIYGSVARGEEKPTSDVDLLIVGEVGLADLAPVLRRLEKNFSREVNARCFTPEEFKEKIRGSNHFLTAVLKENKIFIKGGADELDRLAQ
jgi:predicted nucleotidyltransferase